MKNRNKLLIQDFQSRSGREYDFPKEHLGIADRLILNNIVNNLAEHFRQYDPKGKVYLTAVFLYDVRKEMKRYGYKVRDADSDC